MKHRNANKSKSKRTLPSSLPFNTHIKTLRISSQKAGKSGKKKKTTLLFFKITKEEQDFLQTTQKAS
jgi:hypothetical protein